jgi:uncharacterized protein GlcG (DUF336 family)
MMTVAAGALAAQVTTPVSLDTVTLSGVAAKRALTRTEINADTAERLVKACLDYAKARNAGASVFVVSPAGDIVHAQRTDGQTPNNIDSAHQKALTALELRTSTRAALNRWNNLEAQMVRADLNYYLNPGGFPIVVDDQLIGAIGVGGAPGDEACAYEALTKVLGPQPPMAPALPFGGVGNEPPPTQGAQTQAR